MQEPTPLDWKILYKQRKGFLLIENLKAAIEELYQPDYLLVDARTGLTDISGICTLQLPHLDVLLFSLNAQSIDGVSTILKSIRGNKLNREIKTMLVASPVPDMPEWVEARSARFDSARKAMSGPADVVIPYDPFLAFGECIVDGQNEGKSRSHLGKAYDLLADKIIGANSSDVITLLSRADEFIKEGQHDLAEAHFRGVVDALPSSVEAWTAFGKFEKLRRRLQPACEFFEKAYALEPSNCEVLAQLASTYAHVDSVKSKQYFQELLQLDQNVPRIHRVSDALAVAGLTEIAAEGLMRVTALDPENTSAYTNQGQVFMKLRQYRQAVEAYRNSQRLDPNNLVCAFNLGLAYHRLEDEVRAVEYFSKAIDIFEQTKRPAEKQELANSFEAMSRAYHAVGKSEKAIQLLEEAIAIAKELPSSRIFSSTTYDYIPQTRFISEVSLRLQQLRRTLDFDSEKAADKDKPIN